MSDDAPPRKRPSGLGRGLSSLLGEVAQEAPLSSAGGGGSGGGLQMMPVSSIEPHLNQPRRHFDEEALAELADSIRARGLIQPIVVRPHGHRYQIVAGERRWRAAQKARLHEVPVIVREFSDAETLEVAILENIQRRDLNAIEEAEGYQRLVDEFNLTQQEVADVVGKDRSTVANALRVLQLPGQVRRMVQEGQITSGHARALLALRHEHEMVELAREVAERGMSVREVERRVRDSGGRTKKAGTTSAGRPEQRNNDARRIEDQLRRYLQTDVRVTVTGGDQGEVRIAFYSTDDLQRVLELVLGEDADAL